MRDNYYDLCYADDHAIVWNNANAPLVKNTNADLDADTFSSYYNANCSKGRAYLQTFGWMGTRYLWSGFVSDTEYITKCTILDERVEFSREDLASSNR